MRTAVVRLDEDLLSRVATGSVVGLAMGTEGLAKGDKVQLVFPLHSLAWCAEHGGPDHVILPEYVPMCLVQGVLDLIRIGVEIEVVEER